MQVHWERVQLLGDHDPSHDRVYEEGQQNIAQEYENSHQDTDKHLFRSIYRLLVEAHHFMNDPHSQIPSFSKNWSYKTDRTNIIGALCRSTMRSNLNLYTLPPPS